DVTFLRRFLETREELVRVEVLSPPVLLDHEEGDRLDPLIGGEALPALQALPAAANRLANLRVPGVHDLQVVVSAVRTAHAPCLLPSGSQPARPRCGSAGTPGCSSPRPR